MTATALGVQLPPGHPDEFAGLGISPACQLRILLARKKAAGIQVGWDVIWPWAVERVRWPQDRMDREEWKRTIQWAEPAFRAAYEGDWPKVDMSALVVLLHGAEDIRI